MRALYFLEADMKIYGYKEEDTDIKGLMKLKDIGIAASPDTLRAVAKFINDAANELEEMGSDFGHLHLMKSMGSDSIDFKLLKYR